MTMWTQVKSGRIACGDCLDVMRTMQPESVDLIYADPPFNSGKDYTGATGQFRDTWESSADYLQFMQDRLVEMRRILKPTGSIYLHCDDAEMHYLKVAMDGIFDRRNYLNTITWRRAFGHHNCGKYGRNADYLLYYSKTEACTFNEQRLPATKTRLRYNTREDANGQYEPEKLFQNASGLLSQSASGNGDSYQPWNGFDIAAMGKYWIVPQYGKYAHYIEDNFIPGYTNIAKPRDRLDALDAAGLIVYDIGEGLPHIKKYVEAKKGAAMQSIWSAMPLGYTHFSGHNASENTRYPTQKPLHLLKPIIETSSNPGDLVFDPFCGSGTTLVAADQLQRNFMGCDASPAAIKTTIDRLEKDGPFT